jgi:ferrous iron transport protein B
VVVERDIKIDERKLSELLDVPVVYTVGNRNEGIDDLLEKQLKWPNLPKSPDGKSGQVQ